MVKKKKEVRFIKPPNRLREKVGFGGIDPTRLKKGQNYIAKNTFDFEPHAREFLKIMDETIRETKQGKISGAEALDKMSKPVMELKGNGGMFNYRLISEIADIALNFIENLNDLNEDAFVVLEAHQRALRVIVANKLTGDGGAQGRALAKELYNACNRFYDRYNVKPQGVSAL